MSPHDTSCSEQVHECHYSRRWTCGTEKVLYLLRCKREQLISLVQHQMRQTQEEETVAGQQTHQSEGSGHQQQTWSTEKAAFRPDLAP